MKKTLLTILLGASLTFGAGNVKAQQEDVEFYNHDEDESKEEIICWKKEGFDEAKQKYLRYGNAGLTILYWEDKDHDNFHENITIFNCYSDYPRTIQYSESGIQLEEFYIDKKTGLIDHNVKSLQTTLGILNRDYAHEDFKEMVKKARQHDSQVSHPYLTPQKLYEMGIDERVKKLINAGERGNKDEIKRLVEVERNYFKANH